MKQEVSMAMIWLSIISISALGTFGLILFKYATVSFGSISINRLLDLSPAPDMAVYFLAMCTGTLLFVYGGIKLRKSIFVIDFLFNRWIILALFTLFFSRLLIIIPLSVAELGILYFIKTILGVIANLIAGAIVFRERYSSRVLIGITLVITAILLISI